MMCTPLQKHQLASISLTIGSQYCKLCMAHINNTCSISIYITGYRCSSLRLEMQSHCQMYAIIRHKYTRETLIITKVISDY